MCVDGELSEEVKTQRGICQAWVLSPQLFNLYSERIFQNALGLIQQRILVNGIVVNNIRRVDDTVLLITNLDERCHGIATECQEDQVVGN